VYQNKLEGILPDLSQNTKLKYFGAQDNQCSDTQQWQADTSNYPAGCSVRV